MRKQSIPGCLSPPMWPGYEARRGEERDKTRSALHERVKGDYEKDKSEK